VFQAVGCVGAGSVASGRLFSGVLEVGPLRGARDRATAQRRPIDDLCILDRSGT
jgi:hypothetical protein